jgi:hypothetical protein
VLAEQPACLSQELTNARWMQIKEHTDVFDMAILN